LYQPLAESGARSAATDTVGAVPSYLKPFDPVPTLPAPSVQLNDTDADPSSGLLYDLSASQPPGPLGPLFEADAEKVTAWLYQPLAESGARSAATDTVGAVASRLIVTDFEFVPPLLVAVHVKVEPEVSAVTLLEPQPL
jgi:hypothetical protein